MRAPRPGLACLGRLHRQARAAVCRRTGRSRRCKVGQLAIVEMQDPLHGAVQQATVMADDDDGMGIVVQIAFQPQRPFEVEIVGRLVQQQHSRAPRTAPRQRHPHPPAAREGRTGLQHFLRREAQALEDRRGPGLGRPGVDIGQPGLDLGDAGRIMGGLGLKPSGWRVRYRRPARCREARSPRTAPPAPPHRCGRGRAAGSRPHPAPVSPRISRNSVVLPAPLRPTRPTLWPVGITAVAFSIRGRPSME